MAESRVAFLEALGKGEVGEDWLREGVKRLAQALMELEVSRQIGAARPCV